MERLCFDERDTNFHRTTPSPRLPPPVLGRDGKISFPPIEGFGEKAPPAQGTAPAAHVRMQFVPAGVTAHHAPRPSGRPSVQIDDAAPQRQPNHLAHASHPPTPQTPQSPMTEVGTLSSANKAQTPRTPQTPQTPQTPGTPRSPNARGVQWGPDEAAQDQEHPPRSPEMPPGAGDGAMCREDADDAAAFAPGADDDDAGNFAPGAEYASEYAAASSSGYADDEYAPATSPKVRHPRAPLNPSEIVLL
jgi:hypothetical protein